MGTPDVIYVVRPGEKNDALRFSLRSLENVPHRRVIIAGYCPGWVRKITVVPVNKTLNKFDTIEKNLLAALRVPDLQEDVLYWNDDFYVTEPVDSIPVMHAGSTKAYDRKNELRWRMEKTVDELGMIGPLNYELHVPLPIRATAAAYCLSTSPPNTLWRTWYGNSLGIDGDEVQDVKTRDREVIVGRYMSSSAKSLSRMRPVLEDILPRRSPYA